MAEAIAVGASVIAIIQITDRIVNLCKYYIETVQDAPSDLRVILVETSVLKTIFENLKFLTACNNGLSTIPSALCGADASIEGCLKSVTELEKLFPNNGVQSTGQNRSKKRKLKATVAALAWPLKESKAKKLLDEIMRYKTTITLAITTESIQGIKDIKATAKEVHSLLIGSQHHEVYTWLQHTDPSSLHYRARKDYEPGTGHWMIRTPEWASWLNTKDRCLWLHGIPGAGKTVLMSYLIEQIKQLCDETQQTNYAYVYYYCYFGHNQDETAPILRWLINQLCRQVDAIPEHVYRLYQHGGEPSVADLLEGLERILERFDLVYMVIDALDESNPREELLCVLQCLGTDSRFEKLRLLTSSREYIDIEKTMEKFSLSVSMANPHHEEDIRKQVRSSLQSNSKFRRWPKELLTEVEDGVSTGARGMFRWAVCQIDVLQRLKCERSNVEKALRNLPKTLDETYDRILLALPEEDRLSVQHILNWIPYDNELYHEEGVPCEILIQAVVKSTAELSDDGLERFYDHETLRELCGCLIKISSEDQGTTGVVSFAHYTVREYLDSSRSKISMGSEKLRQRFLSVRFQTALHIEPNKLSETEWQMTDPSSYDKAIPSNSTGYHFVSAFLSLERYPDEISQCETLCTLAIDLLDPSQPLFKSMQYSYENATKLQALFFGEPLHFPRVRCDSETGSMVAVHFFNLLLLALQTGRHLFLAEKFLKGKDTMNFLQTRIEFEHKLFYRQTDSYLLDGSIIEVFAILAVEGSGPLELLMDHAAGLFDCTKILLLYINGHPNHSEPCTRDCPLRRLLELGADPDCRGHRITPLQIAVVTRNLDGVRILLDAGADPNATGSIGCTLYQERTFMAQFNHLHGASALCIFRNFTPKFEGNDLAVGAVLLQYGAKDFRLR